MTTAIVVPCFNEAARLDHEAFAAFARSSPDIHFLFVDDGSSDGTRDVLSTLTQREPRCRWIALPENVGKAAAVQSGVLEALKSEPSLVGYWDADLATPLTEIPRFLALFSAKPELWMVMGARVSLLGRDIERRASRHYLGRVFATCAASLLGLSVYDTQCGAKLFRVTPETRALFATPFVSRWVFDVELLARLVERHGASETRRRVAELPLEAWRDIAGSKVRPGDFARAARELLAIARRYPPGR